MKCFYSAILFFLGLVSLAIAEETRILTECYINGQPVKFVFDSGTEGLVLFRKTASRLNLSIKEPLGNVIPQPGKIKLVLTEKCKFKLYEGGMENTTQFAVVDIPTYIDAEFEGFLGWGAIKDSIIEVDSSSRRVRIHDTLEFDKSEWKCLDIRTDLNVLVAKTSQEDQNQDLLLIDTGDPRGLTVKKELWRQVTGDETDSNTSISAMYYPSIGLVVNKERWNHEINFGNLSLHEIPLIMGLEAHKASVNEGVDGILGMWGLSCYQWIIDGSAGKIYFKENDLIRIPEMYDYDRLGAVFVPEDIQAGNALIAHVVENGPAWRAGIRDGDELLKIGQVDATKWRIDPSIMPLGQYWEKPAGTIIELVLLQNGEERKIAVRLEEIFKQE